VLQAIGGEGLVRDAPLREIDADELKTRLERGERLVLLDVRTPEEYGPWHIDGTVNIPVQHVLAGEFGDLPRDREVITICSHGNRSATAAQALGTAGYRVTSLRGGMVAWNRVFDAVQVPLALPGDGRLVQVRRVGKGCIGYVLVSDGQAAVVDPPCRVERLLPLIEAHGARAAHVLDTHQHADHVSGARRFAARTGAVLHLNPRDEYARLDFEPLGDGDILTVGRSAVRALHAPGHTPGSTLFEIDGRALLTGDTLFVEGVGRPDLRDRARAFAEDLYLTYQRRLRPLPDALLVLPGHYGPDVPFAFKEAIAAPLGGLKRQIPLFAASRDQFVAYVTSRVPERPANAEAIIALNRGEKPCVPDESEVLEEGPNRCAVPVAKTA
jgi:glyoxylase-like metal-dependent hydrolase (beta-lactamase superfamily II)